MHGHELREHLASVRRQLEIDFAPVDRGRSADDEPFVRQTIDETDGAVVLDEKLLREIVDRDVRSLRTRSENEHRLIVLRGETRVGRGRLAEMQKAAQRLPERGELRVIARRQLEVPLGFLQ